MSAEEKIRVMVVDDHPVTRLGVTAMINAQLDMSVVAQAGTGQEATKLFWRHKPDVTLMDLRLPGMSGVEAIRTIRSQDSHARFVVLTTYEGDEDIHQAMEAGASGYLVKGLPQEMLVAAVRRVHGGGRYFPPPVSRALAARTHDSSLSPRERQVLELVAKGRSNREIASALGITEATVKCHVSVILSRLNAADRTQAVMTALQRGLIHL